MKTFGITGNTGAGKSTVSKKLESLGCFVIDGDIIARKITEKGSIVLEALATAFGNDILFDDGALNRSALAKKAFSKKENVALLNKITHGAIDDEIEKQIAFAEKNGFEFAFIDAAALLDSPSKNRCEKIILVCADKNIRLERIKKRDNITDEDAKRRISAQKDDAELKKRCDYVFSNNSTDEAIFEIEFQKLCDFLEIKK